MYRSNAVLCAIFIGTVLLISCRPKYSYEVGFRNCTDNVLWMDVTSSTYSTEVPVPLQKGQISGDNMITVPMPAEMKVTWWTTTSEKRTAIREVRGRLPRDFDFRRDAVWFIACPDAEPRLVAEIGSRETGVLLHQLSDGRRWVGKSIHEACDLCTRVTTSHKAR